ncbi:DUF2382 domain-containing protein [Tolypothrix bouteillei VB521301_2]
MALYQIEDFDTNYHENSQSNNIKNIEVYSDINDEKIGNIKTILVDDTGRISYLVVDTGFWVFGKQVLLPIGRSRVDYNARRIYAKGLTKNQVENLPEFQDIEKVDSNYEQLVRKVYRTPIVDPIVEIPLETSTPLEASAPLDLPPAYAEPKEKPVIKPATKPVTTPVYQSDAYSDTYIYEQEPSLYEVNEQDRQSLKLYEEQLIANKNRGKRGEVTVAKYVKTETARISVPIEKERVIVERTTPADAGQVVSPSKADFREAEVARIEIYEEIAQIQKQPVVSEEVKIKKVVEQDTLETQETIRREELNIQTDEPIQQGSRLKRPRTNNK